MPDDELIFRVLMGVLLVGFVAHRAYYTRKFQVDSPDSPEQPAPGLAQRTASLLAVAGLLATCIYIFYPAWMAWSSLPLPGWLRWLGVLVSAIGFLTLQWSQVTLGKNWSDEPHLREGHQMVTGGPYRWVRHPIYTSFLLILCPTILISANWFVGGTWMLMMVLDVNTRIQVEEQLMVSRYGDQYHQYMARTGRFLPRL